MHLLAECDPLVVLVRPNLLPGSHDDLHSFFLRVCVEHILEQGSFNVEPIYQIIAICGLLLHPEPQSLILGTCFLQLFLHILDDLPLALSLCLLLAQSMLHQVEPVVQSIVLLNNGLHLGQQFLLHLKVRVVQLDKIFKPDSVLFNS